ncbi:MAG: hypothetical protein IPL61_34300 [Myxococcales bacterium]|nr:hypothetical protein [Myxococcales bacterium]
MELNGPVRIGVTAGAVGLALAVTMVRFCGAVSLPPKPNPPSESLATSQEVLRQASQTEGTWSGYLEKDALIAGVNAPTVAEMSRKLVMRADEGVRTLAPGEPAIEAAGLRLSAVATGGTLALVIENRTSAELAYLVVTRPRPEGGCARRDVEPYNANVVGRGGREVRTECSYHDGMSLEISHVESIELTPLQAFYVSKVPPRALGADARLTVGHEPDLPGAQRVCSVAVSQALRSGLDDGSIRWRDLVDFYARHRCDTYQFPMQYRAFVRDSERPLPAAD